MKPGSKEYSESKANQVKENIRDDIRETGITRDLEAKGYGKNTDGKDQSMIGRIRMDVSSDHINALVARPVAGPLMLINLK